jgi:vacuolar-type H+-ATPase subunit E/Vma4
VKTQKILNELREDFNKIESETMETIKKEINEIKKIAQDMKEEFNKHMKSLRKKNQTEILEIKSSLNQIKNTTSTNEIHGIIRDYFEKLYSNKL